MLTYEKALEEIEFLKAQIADLTAERDRLKSESTNASDALSVSHERNSELSSELNDAVNALNMLGIEEVSDELDGESSGA